MQKMREAERGLAGGAGEHHAARTVKLILRQEIVDQKRQHEQRTQQRLVIALATGKGGIPADTRIGIVDRGYALTMRGGVAQAALADVGRLDHKMRRHRKIAEQAFALGNARMTRSHHLAKSPHRNVAEIFGRRKQLPVFQLVAENGVGDVVGGESEAVDLDQQRLIGQGGGVRQFTLDEFALLQILACNDEVGGFHVFDPGFFPAAIFAFGDDRFATGGLLKTAFAFGSPPITPSRFFTAR